jgi:hypothetical protein
VVEVLEAVVVKRKIGFLSGHVCHFNGDRDRRALVGDLGASSWCVSDQRPPNVEH